VKRGEFDVVLMALFEQINHVLFDDLCLFTVKSTHGNNFIGRNGIISSEHGIGLMPYLDADDFGRVAFTPFSRDVTVTQIVNVHVGKFGILERVFPVLIDRFVGDRQVLGDSKHEIF